MPWVKAWRRFPRGHFRRPITSHDGGAYAQQQHKLQLPIALWLWQSPFIKSAKRKGYSPSKMKKHKKTPTKRRHCPEEKIGNRRRLCFRTPVRTNSTQCLDLAFQVPTKDFSTILRCRQSTNPIKPHSLDWYIWQTCITCGHSPRRGNGALAEIQATCPFLADCR